MANKWKFTINAALLDEVLREAVVEAEAEADALGQTAMLVEMLLPPIQQMLATGATPRQIAVALRYMATAGEEAQAEEEGKRR